MTFSTGFARTVGDDDVAELALEGTASGGLDASEPVSIDFEQVNPRWWTVPHVDLFGLDVVISMGAAPPLGQEARPRVFPLALEQDVAMGTAAFRKYVANRTAHANELPASPEAIGNLE